MPQLDTATFRGQVTWLVIVFIVLYRARTGEILPKVSRIVKIRSKKRERTRGEARQYDGERTSVDQGYSGRLGNAAGSSYGFLQERTDVQTNWMNKEIVNRNQTPGMSGAMQKYRSHRMNGKLADVYLTQTLEEASLSQKAEGGWKPATKKVTKGTMKKVKAMKSLKAPKGPKKGGKTPVKTGKTTKGGKKG